VKVHQESTELAAAGPGLHDITERIRRIVQLSGIRTGLCTIFVQHTSASLVIQENADPAVQRDLQKWIARVAPESDVYEHDDEGADDMPAHLRSAMTRTTETVPVSGGDLALGTWQAVYLWEHRRASHRRRLVLTIIGS
jgi:secondary thiamine-phosphate synthase enzyme